LKAHTLPATKGKKTKQGKPNFERDMKGERKFKVTGDTAVDDAQLKGIKRLTSEGKAPKVTQQKYHSDDDVQDSQDEMCISSSKNVVTSEHDERPNSEGGLISVTHQKYQVNDEIEGNENEKGGGDEICCDSLHDETLEQEKRSKSKGEGHLMTPSGQMEYEEDEEREKGQSGEDRMRGESPPEDNETSEHEESENERQEGSENGQSGDEVEVPHIDDVGNDTCDEQSDEKEDSEES